MFRHLEQVRQQLVDGWWQRVIGIAVAAALFLFSDLLAPESIEFWIALLMLGTAAYLLLARRYWRAIAAACLLPVHIAYLIFSADYLLVAGTESPRLRSSSTAAYLQVSKDGTWSKIASRFFGKRLIAEASCDGVRIARLPLIGQGEVIVTLDEARLPLRARRTQWLVIKPLTVNVLTSMGGQHARHGAMGLGFAIQRGNSVLPLQAILPRHVTCTFERVPLFPLAEFIPYISGAEAQLIDAVRALAPVRASTVGRAISPADIARLEKTRGLGPYQPLVDYVAFALLSHMLQGNAFSDVRADLTNSICHVLNGNALLFSGPLASLREYHLLGAAQTAGANYREVFPACQIEPPVLKFVQETASKTRDDGLFAMWRKCFATESPQAFRKCLAEAKLPDDRRPVCVDGHCKATPPGFLLSEAMIADIEERYLEKVVDTAGQLRGVDELDLFSCPQLRGMEETHHYYQWEGRSVDRLVKSRASCHDPDWNAKYQAALRRAEKVHECRAKLSLPYDDPQALEAWAEQSHFTRCGRYSGGMTVTDLLVGLSGSFRLLDTTTPFEFSAWIGSDRAQSIAQLARLFVRATHELCSGSISDCPRILVAAMQAARSGKGEAKQIDIGTRALRIAKEELGLELGDSETPGDIVRAFSNANNYVLNLLACHALAFDHLRATFEMDREAYCTSRGLARHLIAGEIVIEIDSRRPYDLDEKLISSLWMTQTTKFRVLRK